MAHRRRVAVRYAPEQSVAGSLSVEGRSLVESLPSRVPTGIDCAPGFVAYDLVSCQRAFIGGHVIEPVGHSVERDRGQIDATRLLSVLAGPIQITSIIRAPIRPFEASADRKVAFAVMDIAGRQCKSGTAE
jgi:hypothetical protein